MFFISHVKLIFFFIINQWYNIKTNGYMQYVLLLIYSAWLQLRKHNYETRLSLTTCNQIKIIKLNKMRKKQSLFSMSHSTRPLIGFHCFAEKTICSRPSNLIKRIYYLFCLKWSILMFKNYFSILKWPLQILRKIKIKKIYMNVMITSKFTNFLIFLYNTIYLQCFFFLCSGQNINITFFFSTCYLKIEQICHTLGFSFNV